jgi:hypothetical protein
MWWCVNPVWDSDRDNIRYETMEKALQTVKTGGDYVKKGSPEHTRLAAGMAACKELGLALYDSETKGTKSIYPRLFHGFFSPYTRVPDDLSRDNTFEIMSDIFRTQSVQAYAPPPYPQMQEESPSWMYDPMEL